jgi:hypothetical protein
MSNALQGLISMVLGRGKAAGKNTTTERINQQNQCIDNVQPVAQMRPALVFQQSQQKALEDG